MNFSKRRWLLGSFMVFVLLGSTQKAYSMRWLEAGLSRLILGPNQGRVVVHQNPRTLFEKNTRYCDTPLKSKTSQCLPESIIGCKYRVDVVVKMRKRFSPRRAEIGEAGPARRLYGGPCSDP